MTITWQAVSDDPNSSEAKNTVIAAMKKSRCRSGVCDRVAFLAEQVCGKEVIDIGVVEHTT